MPFLPVKASDMRARGWESCDFVCITGDGYVDHPAFGTAIITRVLEAAGYRVGILAQPDWHDPRSVLRLGIPRLGFLVNAGNIDSMVAHYTVAGRRRSDDAYTPGGKAGKRPDRAVDTYCALIRSACPESFIIIGGIEASLRRFAHYDYWEDAVRPSILLSSGADILSFGMGERSLVEIAAALEGGGGLSQMKGIRGICYWESDPALLPEKHVAVPSFEKISADKAAYARAHKLETLEQDALTGRPLVQKHGGRFLVQNPPSLPLETAELDAVYALPYMRACHPDYEALGGIKGFSEVEFSITHNRGCFGGCSFCSIAFHQGRTVTARSHSSVLQEARKFLKNPRFKGYISDVGGPTANFRHPSCKEQLSRGICRGKRCLAPLPCPHIDTDQSDYRLLLKQLRELPGIKRVFVRSGVRFDYALLDPDEGFLKELVAHHVSGQLRVAPEHCAGAVLDCMGKPHIEVYERFERAFSRLTREAGREQYLVPYLMSSHPGSRMEDALSLALFLKKRHLHPEQVQDFYPTPGTTSTCMYYTGLDPMSGKPVYVARSKKEKAAQRALLQYYLPENRRTVIEALVACGRQDLIGRGPGCLVPPDAQYLREAGAKIGEKASSQKERGRSGQLPGARRRTDRGKATGRPTPKKRGRF